MGGKARLSQANVPIDWNDNRVPTDIHVDADVNYFRDIIGCDTKERGQTLAGRKDWTNLDFDFRDEANYQDHVQRTPIGEPELTAEQPVATTRRP